MYWDVDDTPDPVDEALWDNLPESGYVIKDGRIVRDPETWKPRTPSTEEETDETEPPQKLAYTPTFGCPCPQLDAYGTRDWRGITLREKRNRGRAFRHQLSLWKKEQLQHLR